MSNSSLTSPVPDLFKTGSNVEIITVHDETIVGDVFAFDLDLRLLIIKLKNTSSNTKHTNMTIVNLDNCKNIKTPNEGDKKDNENIDAIKLPDIDFARLEQRVKNSVDERKALARNWSSGAGTDGVLLYHQLVKTFGEREVQWRGDSIIVKNNIISAPYKTDSVAARDPKEKLTEDSVSYLKSIIDKFWATHISSPSPKNNNTTPKPILASTPTPPVPLTAAAVVKMNTGPAKQTKDSAAPKTLRA